MQRTVLRQCFAFLGTFILSILLSAADGAEPRRLLYVVAPGIRNYLEYGGAGILVFDIDHDHRFIKRIETTARYTHVSPMCFLDASPSSVAGSAPRTYSPVIDRQGPVARMLAMRPEKPKVMRCVKTTPFGMLSCRLIRPASPVS